MFLNVPVSMAIELPTFTVRAVVQKNQRDDPMSSVRNHKSIGVHIALTPWTSSCVCSVRHVTSEAPFCRALFMCSLQLVLLRSCHACALPVMDCMLRQ